jgi:catalase
VSETTETKTTTPRKRAPRKAPEPKAPAYQSDLLKIQDEINRQMLRDVADQNRPHFAQRAEAWGRQEPSLSSSLLVNVNRALAARTPDNIRQALLRVAAVALAKVEEIDNQ